MLGKSPAWQDADGACSGYLVEHDDTTLLVDCGSGVFSKLRRVCDYTDVDGVVITHMHPDHFFDLVPYACALTYGPRGHGGRCSGDDGQSGPQLLVPSGATTFLNTLTEVGGQPRLLDGAFAITEYDAAVAAHVGSLQVQFQPVPHYVPANAVDVCCTSGARFTFGADHGPDARARRLRRRDRPAVPRGDARHTRARRPARAPHRRRGGRARRPLPGAAARAHPHLRRARRRLGARRGSPGVRGTDRGRA